MDTATDIDGCMRPNNPWFNLMMSREQHPKAPRIAHVRPYAELATDSKQPPGAL